MTVVFWGFACGLAIIPFFSLAFRTAPPRGALDKLNAKGAVTLILTALVACTTYSFLLIGSGHLLDLIPLNANGPLFGLSFLAGGLLMRFFIEVSRKRHDGQIE